MHYPRQPRRDGRCVALDGHFEDTVPAPGGGKEGVEADAEVEVEASWSRRGRNRSRRRSRNVWRERGGLLGLRAW